MTLLRTILMGGAVSAQICPHSFLLQKYRKIRARYDFEDHEIPVRQDIQRRFEEVIDDLNIVYRPMIPKERIQCFNVHDIEMFHAGITYLKYGGLVGIPMNFEYNNINQINNENITIQSASFQWDAEATKEFHKSLILSENAQKFAMARHILSVTTFDPIIKAFNIFADLFLGAAAYDFLRSYLNITKQQRAKNALCMSITAIGVFILTTLTHSELDNYREKEINEIVSKLSKEYIEGGVEYYEKLLQKNRALRVLLGSKGTHMYTPLGNQNTWFIQKKILISEQMDYFKQKMQNIQSKLV